MTTYADHLTEDRRLVILRCLNGAPGYTGNDSILHDMVESFGHTVSRDQVRTDISWLAEQGLLELEKLAGVYIVKITKRGQDVATGRADQPGVKKPGP